MPALPSPRKSSSRRHGADHKIDQSVLLGLVGYNCRRAYLRIFDVFRKRMAPFRLKPVEYSVLALIQSNENLSQKLLAHALGIKPPNMATLLDRLETRQLVIRQKDQPDKRFHALELTALGKRVYSSAEKAVNRLELEATDHLKDGERTEVLRLLQKIFLVK